MLQREEPYTHISVDRAWAQGSGLRPVWVPWLICHFISYEIGHVSGVL